MLGFVAMTSMVSACSLDSNSNFKPKENSDPLSVLPFYPDAPSFANYLNNLSWNDGKKRTFRDLGNCFSNRDLDYNNDKIEYQYFCTDGYVTVKDPVNGKRLCELRLIYDPGEEDAVVRYQANLELVSGTYEWGKQGRVKKGSEGNCR